MEGKILKTPVNEELLEDRQKKFRSNSQNLRGLKFVEGGIAVMPELTKERSNVNIIRGNRTDNNLAEPIIMSRELYL